MITYARMWWRLQGATTLPTGSENLGVQIIATENLPALCDEKVNVTRNWARKPCVWGLPGRSHFISYWLAFVPNYPLVFNGTMALNIAKSGRASSGATFIYYVIYSGPFQKRYPL